MRERVANGMFVCIWGETHLYIFDPNAPILNLPLSERFMQNPGKCLEELKSRAISLIVCKGRTVTISHISHDICDAVSITKADEGTTTTKIEPDFGPIRLTQDVLKKYIA